MIKGLRSTWLAGGGAMLLILSVSGIAAGATLVADTAETVVEPAEPPEGTTDTTLTFEDIDGNGIDDDCQDDEAVESAEGVTAALLAVDLDGDGTISVSEAAQSDWIGGPNCNHGGYVSWVAHDTDDACDPAEAEEPADAEEPTITPVVLTENTEDADEDEESEETAACDEAPAEATDEDEDAVAENAECEAPTEEPPAEEAAPGDTAPNAHGKAVSAVAQSDAVGGKNCNHGGAVSQVAKDKDLGNAEGKANGKGHGKGHGKGKGGQH